VLAPPTVAHACTRIPQYPSEPGVAQAHRHAYAGQWVALHDGHFLAAAPSFDALAAQVNATPDADDELPHDFHVSHR
jgi:hypothetical protein